MKPTSYLLVLSFLFFTSCQKETDTATTSLQAQTLSNVSYGTDARHVMDVYLPADRNGNTKVMIVVHGGAWNAGNKSDLTIFVDSFRRRMPDYAIFNINYRLATSASTVFPTQENDVKAAVEYIHQHASHYSISQKMVMIGVSAGAHLSLLQAYKHQSNVRLKAVVSFFGPTDMIDMYRNPANPLVPQGLVSVIGATPTQDSSLYARSSPINYVSSTSPATLLLHGGTDVLVRPSQSAMLHSKLQAAGVTTQYVFYPSEGHGWFGATLSDSFDKIQTFLTANVQ
jgi:acetyl esterase/lipase